MSIKAKINSQIFQDSNNIYYPKNESEVSELIKDLYKNDSPTEIIGHNSKSFIGNKAQSANTMSLSKLTGIIDYRPEELYIKVKACTPIEEVEKILDENNQELAFEPIDFGYIKNGVSNKGTVAGYLSCNYAGSRRFKVGSVRDHVLGFKGVNGKGDLIKSGGTVVKNVTGYDLSKLIAGSFGTLVALTEITLKVLPKKDSSNTIAIYIDKSEEIFDLFIKYFFLRFLCHFRCPGWTFMGSNFGKKWIRILIQILMIFLVPPTRPARGVRSLPGGFFDT